MLDYISFITIYWNQNNLHISQDAQTVAESALTDNIIPVETG